MNTSMACKTSTADVCVSEPVGVISSQKEINLIEINEAEYLQHIIQTHIEAQVSETHSSKEHKLNDPEKNVSEDGERLNNYYPQTPSECLPEITSGGQCIVLDSSNQAPVSVQEIKMFLVNEPNSVVGGEKTQTNDGEVPGFVLDKIRCLIDERTDQSYHRGSRPLDSRPNPPARICLEKRFLSMLCHSVDAQGVAIQKNEKWTKSHKMVNIQCTYPYGRNLLNTLLDGSQQSELIDPKELSFNYRADKGADSVLRAPCIICTNTSEPNTAAKLENEAGEKSSCTGTRRLRSSNVIQISENFEPVAGVSGSKRGRKAKPPLDQTQRREIHNRKERDRRRRIRLYCDELNLLVPFCYTDTDKATTLQWTTAFLKYIKEIHGDSFKQDFQKTFCGKTGLRLNPTVAVNCVEPCTGMMKF